MFFSSPSWASRFPSGSLSGSTSASAGSLAAVPAVVELPGDKVARAATTETQPAETTPGPTTTVAGDDRDDLPGKCRKPENSLDPDCDPRSEDDDDSSGPGSTATGRRRRRLERSRLGRERRRGRLERPRLGRRRLDPPRPTASLPSTGEVFTAPGGALFPAPPSLEGAVLLTEPRRFDVYVHEDHARPGARHRL